jgi:hypothetical protein
MKHENLFASQGGPIIISQVLWIIINFFSVILFFFLIPILIKFLLFSSHDQKIENEYGNVIGSYGNDGKEYVQWCASLAESYQIGVPWVMCQESDAPSPMVYIILSIIIIF